VLTPDELRQIRRLSVQAGRRVDSLFAGGYRSAFRGRGMEFDEVRPYVAGDDIRHIDWNVTARSSEPHVKVFHEERELTILLAVDVSASMSFGSGGEDGITDKRRQLARVAGALAYAAIRANDRVGLIAFTDRVEHFVPPRKSRGHAWRVIREVYEHNPSGHQTDLAGAIDHIGKLSKRRTIVVLLSDFLDGGQIDRPLSILCRKHDVHALLIADKLEEGLGGAGLMEIVEAETGSKWLVDGLSSRTSVDERVAALSRSGAKASAIWTDRDPFNALMRHFGASR
jgi:uncharacterized protein (DUF58 family)